MGIRCGKNAAVFKSRPVLPAVAWEAAAGKARRASDGPRDYASCLLLFMATRPKRPERSSGGGLREGNRRGASGRRGFISFNVLYCHTSVKSFCAPAVK